MLARRSYEPAQTAPAADTEPGGRELDDVLAELEGLIGLQAVKLEVELVTNLLVVQGMRAERGLPTLPVARHLGFTGNPGTGKTTVARLVADSYRALGVLDRGHLVETDRLVVIVTGYPEEMASFIAGNPGRRSRFPRTIHFPDDSDDELVAIAHHTAHGAGYRFDDDAVETI